MAAILRALVVIVTYESASDIGDLLDSVPAATVGLDTDVVVVDNGSTDGTPDLVLGRGDTRVIRSTNRGFAAGINLGVASSEASDAIVVLNADTRLAPESVTRLVEALALPGVGITAPKLLSSDGGLIRNLRCEPSLLGAMGLSRLGIGERSEYLTDPESYSAGRFVDWATGAALCISRACFDQLSGWDESFFLYSEETDFCLRARDKGFGTLYVPDAEVMHMEGGSGRSARTYSMQEVNRVRLFRRRHGSAQASVVLLALAVRHLTRFVGGDAYGLPVAKALLWPGWRPPEIGCSRQWLPR